MNIWSYDLKTMATYKKEFWYQSNDNNLQYFRDQEEVLRLIQDLRVKLRAEENYRVSLDLRNQLKKLLKIAEEKYGLSPNLKSSI